MREILFRGKNKNNEWIYGFYKQIEELSFIWPSYVPDSYDRYIVKKETVEQFTGLIDKNGTKIFEGDIIKIHHEYKNREFEGVVEWLGYKWGCKDFYFSHFDEPSDIFSEGTQYIEVISNIHN